MNLITYGLSRKSMFSRKSDWTFRFWSPDLYTNASLALFLFSFRNSFSKSFSFWSKVDNTSNFLRRTSLVLLM